MVNPLLLVLLSTIGLIFGPGFQSIEVFSWIAPAALVIFCRVCSKWQLILGYLSLTLGTWVSYAGIFNYPDWNTTNVFSVLLIAAAACILLFLPFLLDRLFIRKFPKSHPGIQILVFPFSLTTAFLAMGYVSPIGSFASWSYSLSGNDPLYQVTSLAGLSALNFLLGLFASCAAHAAEQYFPVQPVPMIRTRAAPPPLDFEDPPRNSEDGLISPRSQALSRYLPLVWFFAVIAAVLLFGGSRMIAGNMYQKSIDEVAPRSFRAGCVISVGDLNDSAFVFNNTMSLAKVPGVKLVMWSETAVVVHSPEEEGSLISRVSSLASNLSVHIGMTYLFSPPRPNSDEPFERNMFVFIRNDGSIGFKYQKSHPVYLVESTVIPGPTDLPYADTTDLGRVGGSICFDFEFPEYIRQSSEKGIDVMLQPSWTWGPLYNLHAHMDATRAVENGFSMFRCATMGDSGAFGPHHQVYAYKRAAQQGTYLADIPLQTREQTVYGVMGDTWGWICTAMTAIALILVCVPANKLPPKARQVLHL